MNLPTSRYGADYDLDRNSDLRITIYGSYYPSSEMQFLIEQRDFLRSLGFTKANLVVDYPGLTDKPLKKINC